MPSFSGFLFCIGNRLSLVCPDERPHEGQPFIVEKLLCISHNTDNFPTKPNKDLQLFRLLRPRRSK